MARRPEPRAISEAGEPRDPHEDRLERSYTVRQVTDYQVSWTERARGQRGAFTVQLILDKGVTEYILAVDPEDLDCMLTLLKASDHVMFDLDRKVLIFEDLDVD